MLTFLAPFWLLLLPPVFAVGLWTLWRGQTAPFPVSSIRLWQGLVTDAAPRRRLIDPAWFLVALASFLVTFALAQPAWRLQSASPHADVQLVLRARPDAPAAELFLKTPDPLPSSSLLLRLTADGYRQTFPLDAAALRRGLILPNIPLELQYAISIEAQGLAHPLAAYRLLLHDHLAFALQSVGLVPEPLRRIFALQPGARLQPPDAPDTPAVYLVDNPQLDLGQLPLSPASLVIASPRTPLPGLTPLSPSPVAPDQMTPRVVATSPLLDHVHFDQVRVQEVWRASLNQSRRGADTVQDVPATYPAGPWSVLGTVQAMPWIVRGRDPESGATLLWIGSEMTPRATNWPLDPSFVIFFTNTLNDLFPLSPDHARTWQAVPLADPATRLSAASVPLASGVALAGLLLLSVAAILLARRVTL